MIVGGIAAGLGAVYFIVDHYRGKIIDKDTDHLISASATRSVQGRPLQLSPRELYLFLGRDTYKAVKRYEKIYAALEQQAANPNFKQIMNLLRED